VVLLPAGRVADAEECLRAWAEYLATLGREWEIVVVDDATPGPERAAALAAVHPGIQVVSHAGPPGEGAALRSALPRTTHPLLFYTLLDTRFRPADLALLLQKRLDPAKPDWEIDHVHLVSGYRAAVRVPAVLRPAGVIWRVLCRILFSHAPRPLPGWLGWRAHLGRALARATFAVRYHDVGCPFRLLRREVFERMPLQSDGPFVHVEILAKSNFLGHVLGAEEVPLHSHPPMSEPRPGGSLAQVAQEFYRVMAHPALGAPGPLGSAGKPEDEPGLPAGEPALPSVGAEEGAVAPPQPPPVEEGEAPRQSV
jgi:hypothetical protein